MKRFQVSAALAWLAAFGLLSSTQAADVAQSKDPSFLGRYQGSEIIRYEHEDYDRLSFWVDPDLSEETREGELTRLVYRVPAGPTSIEVFRNYEHQLKQAGFKPALAGTAATLNMTNPALPSRFIERRPWGDGLDIGLVEDAAFYTGGSPSAQTPDRWVSVMTAQVPKARGPFQAGDLVVAVDMIEARNVPNKMVDGNADELAAQIEKAGKVSLYGIFFETDKVSLQPESGPSMEAIAKLMKAHPDWDLLILGHTDNVGEAGYNQRLSLGRANAVLADLVLRHDIDARRLRAEGRGMSDPIASNETDVGRAQNRRVELVRVPGAVSR